MSAREGNSFVFLRVGPVTRRVMKWIVISESYDFGELCLNHAQIF